MIEETEHVLVVAPEGLQMNLESVGETVDVGPLETERAAIVTAGGLETTGSDPMTWATHLTHLSRSHRRRLHLARIECEHAEASRDSPRQIPAEADSFLWHGAPQDSQVQVSLPGENLLYSPGRILVLL